MLELVTDKEVDAHMGDRNTFIQHLLTQNNL